MEQSSTSSMHANTALIAVKYKSIGWIQAHFYLGCKIGNQLARADFSICLCLSSKVLCSQGRVCRASHVIIDFQRLQDHLHNPSANLNAFTKHIVHRLYTQQMLAGKTCSGQAGDCQQLRTSLTRLQRIVAAFICCVCLCDVNQTQPQPNLAHATQGTVHTFRTHAQPVLQLRCITSAKMRRVSFWCRYLYMSLLWVHQSVVSQLPGD